MDAETAKLTRRPADRGMQTFILVWFGQLVSLTGSGLTGFALGVWVYQLTGSVTQLAFMLLCTTLPRILLAPLAGALSDRWDRRRVMILSDSGAALGSLLLASLLLTGRLELWQIYLIVTGSAAFGAFQWPAFTAATTLLVPKEQLGRASGMTQASQALAQLIAPAAGGLLLVSLGLSFVILIDCATFLCALATLLLTRFPAPEHATGECDAQGSLWREATHGWRYLNARPGLLGLLAFFVIGNFLVGIIEVLVTPLVLSFATASALGLVLSIGGSGMLVGSAIMSAWGGPRRQIHAVFGFMLLGGGCMILAGSSASIPLLTVAAFVFFLGLPIINGASLVILQRKVTPVVQGRVFALINAVAGAFLPLAYVLAGPLADRIFEPLMAAEGALAGTVGLLIGTGPGRGIALLFIILGVLTMLATLAAWCYPRVRRVEDELPDAI